MVNRHAHRRGGGGLRSLNKPPLQVIDNQVAHVVAPVYPGDLVLYVVKIIPPLKIFP